MVINILLSTRARSSTSTKEVRRQTIGTYDITEEQAPAQRERKRALCMFMPLAMYLISHVMVIRVHLERFVEGYPSSQVQEVIQDRF